jgi:hypothetical protein
MNPSARNTGFALVMTVMLLAFLVLLLVAISTLTRIETGVAGAVQAQAQARQNALVALDIALGQLQLMAGPDQRVTAGADPASAINPHYAGVWDATSTGTTPLTWLVSGNEHGDPLAVTPLVAVSDSVELVGRQTSGRAGDVVAPRQPIRSVGVPGESDAVVTGHYAWWIGDQGVKAPAASSYATETVDYAPYDSRERQRRWQQQAGPGSGPVEFEPTAASNNLLVRDLTAFSQLAFLSKEDGSRVGLATLRQNYHAWSPDNHAVLANTKSGGLREDLSLRPELLGPAFVVWSDYAAGIENPAAPAAPVPSPAYAGDPLRRRQRMAPATSSGNVTHGIWPVLTYFLLTFNVRTQGGSSAVKPIEVRARWMLTLWNPWTSALVPENLRVEITGLPAAVQVVDETLGSVPATISLPAAYGSPLRIQLPWDATSAPDADRQSWLPGRVYTWTSLEYTAGAAPTSGYASRFYSRNLSADAGQGVQHSASAVALDGDDICHLAVAGNHTLKVRLSAARPGGDVPLATFTSPEFSGFSTTPRKLSAGTYQIGYLFRLAESFDSPAAPGTWLTAPGGDARRRDLGPEAFVTGANGNRPELYENYTTISAPDRLLDRAANARSYNEDVPLFELPRAPLLSCGQLQHLPLEGTRPFAIGNSWGATAQANGLPANALFDRFYFSGLAGGMTLPPGKPLPNPGLRVLPRKPDGTVIVPGDLVAPSGAASPAKYLLQGGAFNLNSVNRDAWLAVLRCERALPSAAFDFLDVSATTGTAGDATTRTLASAGARFFRFPQSAQETWKADDPGGSSTYAASTTVPPAAPNNSSGANTQLFRRGLRVLDDAQTGAFADAIVALMKRKHAASGPWRSLEEFLNPSALFTDAGGRPVSLLEKAIADAGLNAAIPEFSSSWLLQGDIMTALAPILFPRSDTFVIRTYGDTFNPVTGATEGRAWSEALVQRLPEYCDAANPAETPPEGLNAVNARLGRRFRIVSFRWLTRADI